MHVRTFLLGALSLALLFGLAACDSGGADVESLGDSTTVSFDESEAVVAEGVGTYEVSLSIDDAGFKAVPATISYSASESSATRGEDLDVPSDTTILFPEEAASGSTRPFPIAVVDDDVFAEGAETAVFTVSVPDSVGGAGDVNSFTLTIEENDTRLSISEARSRVGEEVAFEGTVSRAFGNYAWVQDDSGPTGASGLYVRQTSGDFNSDVQDGTITAGTQVRITGTVGEFNGNIQINEENLADYEILGEGEQPAPQDVDLADLDNNGEDYEGELVRATGLGFPSASGTFSNNTNYDVEDGSTTFTLRVQGDTQSDLGGTSIPDNRFTYTGVVGEFNGSYQLIPVQTSDLDEAESIASARSAGPGTEVTVTGTITRAFGNFARIQDDSGPTGASAFYVRQTEGAFFESVQDGTIDGGTRVTLTGTIGEFNGNLQVNEDDLEIHKVVAQGSVPSPQSVTLNDLASNGEDYEAELVEVSGLEFPSASGSFSSSTSYDVEDGSTADPFTLRVQGDTESDVSGEPIPSGSFTYTGVVGEFNGTYQLIPVLPSDIQ